jgi:peptidoglycan/xylan/chitin deacetylase (PgdA/CDA1 family)
MLVKPRSRRRGRLSAARQRLLAAASVYLIMVVAPTVAYDFPHPVRLDFNGRSVRMMGVLTMRDLLKAEKISLRVGRLLDVSGGVLKSNASLPVVRVNGVEAMSTTKLKTGDAIEFKNGQDTIEPSEVEVLRTGMGNPQFLLGPGAIEVKHGLDSGITIPVNTKPSAGPKAVALTFDDGPNPGYTDRLLDVLKAKHVHVTFFDVGRMAQAYPDLVKREIKEGHVVANHSWSHPMLAHRSDSSAQDELQKTRDLLRRLGATVTLFRPPYGSYTGRTVNIAQSLGMRTVVWSVDPADYRRPPPSSIVQRVMSFVRPGAVILMHDGGGDRSNTIAAVPILIDQLRKLGYSFEVLG